MKSFTHVSPSQISTFRTCQRKWWLNKILGLPIPQHPSAALGEAVHKTIETFFESGNVGDLHTIALPARPKLEYLRTLAPRIEHTDKKTLRNGLIMVQRLDVLALDATPNPLVVDHKTSSSEKYALTEQELRSDIQMLSNAYAAYCLKPAPAVTVAHNFLRTKGGPYHRYTDATIPTADVMAGWRRIQDITDEMREVARIQAPADVRPTESACDKYGGCAFRQQCAALKKTKGASMVPLSPYAGFDDEPAAPSTPPAPAPAAPTTRTYTEVTNMHKASVLRDMGIDTDTIKAGIVKGTIIDDLGLTGPAVNGSTTAANQPAPKNGDTVKVTSASTGAPAKATGINPPEGPGSPRAAKQEAAAIINGREAGAPTPPAAPAPVADPEKVFAEGVALLKSHGWDKDDIDNLSDDAFTKAVAKNIKRADVREFVTGTGKLQGEEYDDLIIDFVLVTVAAPRARPSRTGAVAAPPAPVELVKQWYFHPEAGERYVLLTPTEAQEAQKGNDWTLVGDDAAKAAHEKARIAAASSAVQPEATPPAGTRRGVSASSERQPRNAVPRLEKLGYPAEVIADMDNAEKRRILDGNDGAGIPYSGATAKLAAELGGALGAAVASANGVTRAEVQAAQDEADDGEDDYLARIAELEAQLAKTKDLLGKTEDLLAEADAASATTGASAAQVGLHLLIDCYPEHTDRLGHKVMDLDSILAPYQRRVEQEGYRDEKSGKQVAPVANYDLIPYNNGAKVVIGYFLNDIAKILPADKAITLVVDSRMPCAVRALEILRPMAKTIVVGRGR